MFMLLLQRGNAIIHIIFDCNKQRRWRKRTRIELTVEWIGLKRKHDKWCHWKCSLARFATHTSIYAFKCVWFIWMWNLQSNSPAKTMNTHYEWGHSHSAGFFFVPHANTFVQNTCSAFHFSIYFCNYSYFFFFAHFCHHKIPHSTKRRIFLTHCVKACLLAERIKFCSTLTVPFFFINFYFVCLFIFLRGNELKQQQPEEKEERKISWLKKKRKFYDC